MNERAHRTDGIKLALFCVVALIIGFLLLLTAPSRHSGNSRASLAEALNNVRQVKFALDGYATDFNGEFPSEAHASPLRMENRAFTSSNDYFRCLFLAGETRSEKIFWARNSPVASKHAPDDDLGAPDRHSRPREDLILQAGDCHWAYMTGQSNTSKVTRPLVMDPFSPDTGLWNPKQWDRKAIVLRIDGSAKVLRMRLSDNAILDGSNFDILSAKADAWVAEPGEKQVADPRKLLAQPLPDPKKIKKRR